MSIRSPRRVWALRGAGVLATLLLLGWAALHWWLPAWLEGRVRAALAERGVEPVALHVHAPGLGGVRITELRLGPGPDLRIGEIALRWSAASLRSARAAELRIRDVEWRLALREGRVDFGSLAPIFEGEAASEPDADAEPLALPLERVRLEGLRVRVAAPGGAVDGRAALDAAFGPDGVESGRLSFEASDAGGALELHGEAVLEPGARIRGEASGRVSNASALPLPLAFEAGKFALRVEGLAPVAGRLFRPEPSPADALLLDASLSAEASGRGAQGAVELTLHVDEESALLQAALRSVRGEGFTVPSAGLSANLRDWTQPIPVLDSLVLTAPEARLGELQLRNLQLDLGVSPEAPRQAGARGQLALRGDAKAPEVPLVGLELGASFEASGDALRIDGQQCVRVAVAAGALGSGGWRLGRPLALCAEQGSARLRRTQDGGYRLEGALALAASEFRLEHRDGRRISGTTPRVEAEGSRDAGGDELRARTTGGSVRLEDLQLVLRGLAAELKLAQSAPSGVAGQLSLALDELRDLAPEPRSVPLSLAAEASVASGRLRFDATARDASRAFRLGATGVHALASGRGHAALELPPLQFREDGLQPQALLPPLAAYLSHVRGGLGGSAQLAWGAHGLEPVRLDLLLDALAADTPWLRLRGLAASLRFEDVLAQTSAPQQRITAQRIDPGLPLDDASLSFTLSAGKLDVHALEAALAGGRLRATGAFDPAAGAGGVELELHELELRELLAGERVEGLAATGRLGGRISAALEGGIPRSLAGRLEADPAGGVIRYRPATPPASLAAAGAGGALALEALRDFHYERLALLLGGDLERAQVRIELRGSNPAVENGRPIEFQLNFTSAFRELLRAWRLEQRFEERLRRPPQATPQG